MSAHIFVTPCKDVLKYARIKWYVLALRSFNHFQRPQTTSPSHTHTHTVFIILRYSCLCCFANFKSVCVCLCCFQHKLKHNECVFACSAPKKGGSWVDGLVGCILPQVVCRCSRVLCLWLFYTHTQQRRIKSRLWGARAWIKVSCVCVCRSVVVCPRERKEAFVVVFVVVTNGGARASSKVIMRTMHFKNCD